MCDRSQVGGGVDREGEKIISNKRGKEERRGCRDCGEKRILGEGGREGDGESGRRRRSKRDKW